MQEQTVVSISEINRLARLALEQALPSCWIRGELSNMSKPVSGHWYFTLKDASASARCVMFRMRNQFVDWSPKEGDQVELRAQASLYEPRGDFQLNVEAMRKAGQGNLYEAFLRLKNKLQQEGLFDSARKKALPIICNNIGVITSPQAAALRDVVITLRQRWPMANVLIYPCQVQGVDAPQQIVQAINLANLREQANVILLVRGGGSLEDLSAFNDEQVARAIYATTIPIVSGVGHETDFTIADFVADARAPTPTGAAQLVVPDQIEVQRRIYEHVVRIRQLRRSNLNQAWQHHDQIMKRLRHPREQINQQRTLYLQLTHRLKIACERNLESAINRYEANSARLHGSKPSLNAHKLFSRHLATRLVHIWGYQQTSRKNLLAQMQTHLDMLCPDLVLERGYSVVRTLDGHIISDSKQVQSGQRLRIQLAKGKLGVETKEIQ